MSYFEYPHTRTYDNDLGWLIRHVKSNQEAIRTLEEWKTSITADISDLQKVIDALRSGKLPDDIAAGIEKWISANFYDIIGLMIKNIWFGLTDTGYFVAYIPESWNDIIFRTTGYDIITALQENYGHLVLMSKGGV